MIPTIPKTIQEMKFEPGKSYVLYYDRDKLTPNDIMHMQIYLLNRCPACEFMFLPNSISAIEEMDVEHLKRYIDLTNRKIGVEDI